MDTQMFFFFMVSTTILLNSGVYRLFGTPFGIKITPPVKHYIILSNKWGVVLVRDGGFCCSPGDTTSPQAKNSPTPPPLPSPAGPE